MSNADASAVAANILFQEALSLDRQDWDTWLNLYDEQIEYWVPSWRNEGELVSDVRREISLIYHTRRTELSDRVMRVRSRKSVTTMPLPRTAHSVTNVLVETADQDNICGTATWTVHEYDPRMNSQHTHFGRYEFKLIRKGDGWKISRKKTILLNDMIPTVIDFYNL